MDDVMHHPVSQTQIKSPWLDSDALHVTFWPLQCHTMQSCNNAGLHHHPARLMLGRKGHSQNSGGSWIYYTNLCFFFLSMLNQEGRQRRIKP